MLSRRTALRRIASLPLIGGVFGGLAGATTGTAGASGTLAGVPAAGSAARVAAEAPFRDYFQELGLRSFINAAGTYTSLTGSLMPKEVVDAIEYARRPYVVLDEIQDRVGERIAELLGCEAATVTSGAFSGMTLGMAGVMCGSTSFTRHWDEVAKAPYLWNPDSTTFISYDDPESLQHKSEFVRARGLGGIMYWEHSHDPKEVLLDAIYTNLHRSERATCPAFFAPSSLPWRSCGWRPGCAGAATS